jgi:hypothetical protein
MSWDFPFERSRLTFALLAMTLVVLACAGCSLKGKGPAPASTAATEDDWDAEEPDVAWGSEFEIDAEASSYFGYPPMEVSFEARPLNGTEPFDYRWSFGDGSAAQTGAEVTHTFQQLGRHDVFVEGRDARGQAYRVQLVVHLVPKEQYAGRLGVDPASLPAMAPSKP